MLAVEEACSKFQMRTEMEENKDGDGGYEPPSNGSTGDDVEPPCEKTAGV